VLDAGAAGDGGGLAFEPTGEQPPGEQPPGEQPPDEQPPPPPLCVLELSCEGEIVDEPKIDCHISVAHGDGSPNYDGPVGVEIRGRSSQAYPKKNYAIELRDGLGLQQAVNLLGMGRESDWVLDGSWIDRSFLRNPLALDLYRSLGGDDHYAPRSRFCQLQLDGEAVGIYRLTERIKRDDDRIDIAEDDGTGGSFVIKQDDEGAVRWDIGEQAQWKLVYPREELATPAQIAGIQRFVDDLDGATYAVDPGFPAGGLFTHVDIDAMVDWVLIEELAKNVDAYNLSVHLWRGAGGLARPVPWDFDLSMGQPLIDGSADNGQPQGWTRRLSRFVQAMARAPAFQQRLVERWRTHRGDVLSEAVIEARIDDYLVTLERGAIDDNFARWPLADVDFRQIYGPYALYPIGSHAAEIARLRDFLRQRLLWIDANIEGYIDGNDGGR